MARYDHLHGRLVPQTIIDTDHTLSGTHHGTVTVKSGNFRLLGALNGTLVIEDGVSAEIRGAQNGTVSIGRGARVVIFGAINGTVDVAESAIVTIEQGGRLAGCLENDGLVIVRGVFGGPQSGSGELRLEGGGRIKQPVVRDGVSYYEW
jgi:hypothetical protein